MSGKEGEGVPPVLLCIAVGQRGRLVSPALHLRENDNHNYPFIKNVNFSDKIL